MMRWYLLCFSFLLILGSLGQKNYTVAFTTDNYKKVKKNIQKNFKDSISAVNYLKDLQSFSIKKGYLLASIDTVSYQDKKFTVSFFLGEKFSNAQLHIAEDDLIFLKRHARLREKYLANVPFQPSEIERLLNTIHNSTISNGYPFSKVQLEKIQFNGAELDANLKIEKGKLYRFKEIHLKGDSSISPVFISSLIDIKEGQLYDESKLKQISKKIGQLSFIKEIKTHELLFTKEGVELYLYLQSVPVSSINGAIGLQPNPDTDRIGLTGELNLKLLNVLKHGELFNLSWRSIQTQTQSLNAKINYPFLFKSPFGIDLQLQMYKRDTTFLELKSTLGIQYFLKGGNFLKVFYQNFSSDMLSGAANNPNFSNLSIIRTNAYGISLFKRQLDYVPNPSKGFGLTTEIAIGSRKTQIVDTIAPLRSTTYRSFFQLEFFIPITARNVIRISNTSELYYAPDFFQNEVYRFGGQNTLRGFNEEELYATYRTVFTIEYRFLLDKNSHLFTFFDQGYYENNSVKYYKDNPYGFGAGIAFGTNIGIFSVSYALGKQMNNPILLSNGKIHFGYIAYF